MGASRILEMRALRIETNLWEVMERITFCEEQLQRMKIHCGHMLEMIMNKKSSIPLSVLSYFAVMNSSAHGYRQLLTEVGCTLERVISDEINKLISVEQTHKFENFSSSNKPDSDELLELGPCETLDSQGSPVNSSSPANLDVKKDESCMLLTPENNENISERVSHSDDKVRHENSDSLNTECSSITLDDDKCDKQSKELSLPVLPSVNSVDVDTDSSGSALKNSSCTATEKGQIPCTKLEKSIIAIEPIKISSEPHMQCKGFLSYASNPLELYVYFSTKELFELRKHAQELQSLKKNNNFGDCRAQNESALVKKQLAKEELGSYALYHSDLDDCIFRVCVKDWKLYADDDSISVHFIDCGMTEDVPLDKLCPMPEKFAKYPACATRCHLAGIIPKNAHPEEVRWNERVVALLREWNTEEESIDIEICEDDVHVMPGSLAVRMYSSKRNACLNQMIKNLQWENSEVVSDEWNPMREDFHSGNNMYEFDIEDPAAAIYGYVGTDYKRICRLFADTGKCFKGDSCTKEHVKFDERGYTVDKEEVYTRAFNSLKMPEPGESWRVRITTVLDATQFYCVDDGSQAKEADQETIVTLQRYMNSERNISEMKKLLVPPSVGQIVIAKFSADDSWYRSRVLEVCPEEDVCRIFFVDYGNEDSVRLSDVRAAEPRYLHLPFQAVRCAIRGVARNPSASYDECLDALGGIANQRAIVEIVAVLPGSEPRALVNLFDSTGDDVGERLLKRKLVQSDSEQIIPLIDSEIVVPG